MKLKIMTYNIFHCEYYKRKVIDFDAVAEVIKNQRADIIGLNEVRGKGSRQDYDAQAKILGEKLGYYYYFAEAIKVGGENPYGNAVLSRYPILSAETVMIPDPAEKAGKEPYETRCLLKAVIDIGIPLTVLVTHFGLNEDEEENAKNTVLENITDRNCILLGDFNVTPENTVLSEIKEKMQDCEAFLAKQSLTFPSDEPVKKIDYIFLSRDIKVNCADIPFVTVSDHRPHTAEIEVE